MTSDLYGDLGLAPDATEAEIKAAHRRHVRKHHPDAGGNREAFERVQHAYLVLSDPGRRERYDRTGDDHDEVENTLSRIAHHIMAAFDQAVGQDVERLFERDLIAATRQIMESERSRASSQLHKLRSDQETIRKLVKRIRFKGAQSDVIVGALNQRLDRSEATAEELEGKIGDIAAALKYLEGYGFDFDQRPTSSAGGSYFFVEVR